MPIPNNDASTGHLPPGDHEATLKEVLERYATTMKRRDLGRGLVRVVESLRALGVTTICIDGSFLNSQRKRPSDVDVWYSKPSGTDPRTWGDLAPTQANRDKIKAREGVDLCWEPMIGSVADATPLPDFWRTDRDGIDKGLVWLTDDKGDTDD